jgi:hypothetical protein
VTSVKPATINTPLFTNSRSRMDVKPKGPPPVYQPDVVAACVVYAAEHPVRDLFAGGAGRLMALQQFSAPRLMDRYLSRVATRQERTTEARPGGLPGNLYQPTSDDRAEGDYSRRARRFSLYTYLETHPRARAVAAGSLLVSTPLLLGRLAKVDRRSLAGR